VKNRPCFTVLALVLITAFSWAQSGSKPPVRSAGKEMTPEQIIEAMAQKESEFYEAWKQYSYHQIAEVKVLEVDGAPVSNQRLVLAWDIVFRDDGTRETKMVERQGRLRDVQFTSEDEEVISDIQPFAITQKELPLYNLNYQGKENVDELSCYVFSVRPRSMKEGRKYFEGKIWVDDQDLQVVRTVGKAVPQTKNSQFPEFETIRQIIDNQYWFPVWTHADSKLRFPGQTVRIEETITYEDYRRFASKTKIKYGDQPAAPEPKQP
jgi:hypothetical protein